MPLIDGATFARRFRGISETDRREFLASLWEARGFDTEIEDDGRVLAEQDGETIRIEVVGWLPRGGTDADLVIGERDLPTARRYAARNDAEFLDSAAMVPLLAYGIERNVGEHIATIHLGTSLTVDPEPADSVESSQTMRRAAFAVALLVAVGAVLAISGVGLPFAGGGDIDGDFPTPEPADQSTGTPDGPAGTGGSAGNSEESSAYPAGLNGSGVTNATTLVNTHRDLVAGRQRTVTLAYRAPADDTVFRGAERHEMAASIHTENRFLLNAEYYANKTDEHPESRTRTWADGEEVHHLEDGTDVDRDYSTRPLSDTSLVVVYESFVLNRFEDAMGVENTSVETVSASGVTLYAVTTTGTPEWIVEEIEGFRAVAHLTTEGRLVRLTISYVHEPTGEPVRMVATYQHLDDVAPPPEPDWVSEERDREEPDKTDDGEGEGDVDGDGEGDGADDGDGDGADDGDGDGADDDGTDGQ